MAAEGFKDTDRYAIQRVLGSGGMGVVYEVFDRDRGMLVALKTLRRLDPAAIYRFKREFRSLARTAHPNLVALYELVAEPHQCFFTMELVPGLDFLRYVGHSTWPGAETLSGEFALAQGRSAPPEPLRRVTLVPAPPVGADEDTQERVVDITPHSGFRRPGESQPGREPTVPRALPLPVRLKDDSVLAGLDEGRLRHAFRQLVEGVMALHELGCLHRDIKPSNVLVTPEGRLVLLDLGLVTWIDPAEASFERYVAGTVAYMSPEQAVAKSLTEPTDWYSVGVMLYEALTGRRPFRGTFDEIVSQKQSSIPTPPSRLRDGVPEDLEAICLDLLSFEPAQRPTGAELLARLSTGAGEGEAPSPPDSALAFPVGRGTTGFVGREKELERLRRALQVVAEGRAVTVHVHGVSGMGKSTLLRRFLDQVPLGHEGAVVLHGRCYQRESVPYKAVDGLVDSLSRYLRSLPDKRVASMLPPGMAALARIFPVLRQVGPVARLGQLRDLDPHELRRRAFAALRQLLDRLSARRPLLLCVDDLQWGDLDSVLLLADLMRPPAPPAVLLIAAYRSDEIASSPHLGALRRAQGLQQPGLNRPGRPQRYDSSEFLLKPPRQESGGEHSGETSPPSVLEVSVGPLDEDAAIGLARSMLSGSEAQREEQARAVVSEARGSPFFVLELLRWLRESEGEDASGEGGGSGRRSRPLRLDSVLDSRLGRLGGSGRRVLETVAVAGRPLPISVLAQAIELGAPERRAIDELRAMHLIRLRAVSGEEALEPYHDRIREALTRSLPDSMMRECHLRLGLALQGSRHSDPEALAEHFCGAGHLEKAGEYALLAAENASEAVAFDRAAMLLRFAMRLLGDEEARRLGLRVRLADALRQAGRSSEAATLYLECTQDTEGYEALEFRARAAEEFLRSGRVGEGLQALRSVLGELRMSLPETPGAALRSLALRRVSLRLRGLTWRQRSSDAIDASDRAKIDICWAVATGLGMIDPIRGSDFQTRGLLLALGCGEPHRVARALVMEATYSAAGGRRGRERSEVVLKEAASLAERLGEPRLRGMVAFAAAFAAYEGGEWTRAREMAERAERIFLDYCSGVSFEIAVNRHFLLLALLQLGELAEMRLRAPNYIQDAEARGDRFTSTSFRNGCMNITWLVEDSPDQAREAVTRAMQPWRHQDFLLQHYEGMYAEASIDLYVGDGAAAWRRLERDWPKLKKAQLHRVQQLHLEALFLKGRAALAAASSESSPRASISTVDDAELASIPLAPRPVLLAQVRQASAAMKRERMAWAEPLAELLLAGIAAAEGRSAEAQRKLEELVPALELRDMRLYAAAARFRLGALRGGEAGARTRRQAGDWLARQDIRNPLAMTRLFAPGFPEPDSSAVEESS